MRLEVEFLEINKGIPYFQKISYVDDSGEFVVYEFIPGERVETVDKTKVLLNTLYDVVSQYHVHHGEGYGYLENPQESWAKFLYDQFSAVHEELKRHIPDTEPLTSALDIVCEYPFKKKLLHGDFGVHNFIFHEEELAGIIDPTPIIGDPLYDLIFAVCSEVHFLKSVSVKQIAKLTGEPERKVLNLLIIVLYCRISTCLYWHPHDLEEYLEIWEKLIES